MDTRKDKPNSAPVIANRRTPQSAAVQDHLQILQTTLTAGSELSIADDADFGSDPYNSTGQYCIVKKDAIPGD
jgi:hypothetical protein